MTCLDFIDELVHFQPLSVAKTLFNFGLSECRSKLMEESLVLKTRHHFQTGGGGGAV